MKDLIHLGLNMGFRGLPREDPNMDWYGHYGEDWNSPYARSSVDLKFTDSNGDGILTDRDTLSINECYGLQHNITPEPTPFLRDLPFFPVPVSTDPIGPGDLVELELHIGQAGNIAEDLYGFNFELLLDPKIVDMKTVQIEFDPNSWISFDSPVLNMVKRPYEGKIEVGYTRTNGKTKTGYGRIGKLRFVVDEDITGFRPGAEFSARVQFNSSGVSNGAGQNFLLPSQFIDIPISLVKEEVVKDSQLKVFPNPTSDRLNVHLNGENEIEEVVLYNITGQQMYRSNRVELKRTSIDMSSYEGGVYILEAITTKGVITKKVQLVRR